jgi:hypothetical protein
LDGHGSGAYTHSQGPLLFRQEICDFIAKRDSLEAESMDPSNIFMTNGASSGIEMVLNALIADSTRYVFVSVSISDCASFYCILVFIVYCIFLISTHLMSDTHFSKLTVES